MLLLSRYKTQFNMSVVTDQGTQPSVNSVFLNSTNYKARKVTRFKRYLLQKEKFQVSMWAGFFSFNTFDKKQLARVFEYFQFHELVLANLSPSVSSYLFHWGTIIPVPKRVLLPDFQEADPHTELRYITLTETPKMPLFQFIACDYV